MASATSHQEFNGQTEGLEVAKAFSKEIRGKTVLITGVNRGGIGFTTAEAFASEGPAHLIIAGRNPTKVQESIQALRTKFPDIDYRAVEVDLSSQKSVRAAAAELLSWSDIPTVDILVNNAAVGGFPERTITEDGVEMNMATNHVGHFLLTCLLMPKLISAAQGNPKGATRIINVASLSPTYSSMRWSDLMFETKNKDLPATEQPNFDSLRMFGVVDPEDQAYIPVEGYNHSKVANLLFSIGATKRLYEKFGILAITVHPGIIQTELTRHMTEETHAAIADFIAKGVVIYQTVGAGAAPALVAALDPKLGSFETKDGKENYGAYMVHCQISDQAHPLAVSSEAAERLWKQSEEWVHQQFSW
ncbi:putative short-chain dehydrogenase [Thozetella sp. PMI_491]|nr:putative short-chain dehydrogenase [Thozetella sp. PMI_491]